MEKDLEQFGGGLRFFQVIVALNFAIGAFTFGAMTYQQESMPAAIIAVEALVWSLYTVLMAMILKVIREKRPWVPKRVVILGSTAVGLLLVRSVAVAGLEVDSGVVATWDEAYRFPSGLMWLLPLIAYFMDSKRVRAYYRADLRTETTREAETLPDIKEFGKLYSGLFIGLGVVLLPLLAILFLVMYFSGVPLF